jgi:hypothetical protein
VIVGSIIGVLAVVGIGIAIWFFVVPKANEEPSQNDYYETEAETREFEQDTNESDSAGDFGGDTIGDRKSVV